MNNLAKKIKWVRELHGFSQDQVSKKTEIPQPSYARYESGTKVPHTFLSKFCHKLHVQDHWLLTDEVSKPICQKIQSTRISCSPTGKVTEFAQMLQVSKTFMSAIECCELMPSEDFILSIAETFKLNRYELLLGLYPRQAPLKSTGDDKADYDLIVNAKNGDLSTVEREIISLLRADNAAVDPVLKLLRGRKMVREAAREAEV